MVFVGQRSSYGATEVPGLLGIDEATLREAIDQGGVAAIWAAGELRIAWEDVVSLGLEHRWTVRTLSAALHGLTGTALPELVRVRTQRVALPRYQWRVLRLMAARRAQAGKRSLTVSDLLEEAVSTAFLSSSEDWARLEEFLPGVRAAVTWPFTD